MYLNNCNAQNQKNTSQKLLYGGLVNSKNIGSLTGSCGSVFSHLQVAIAPLMWKSTNDEERNSYSKMGEIGVIFARRINENLNKIVPANEINDYFQSSAESMDIMQNTQNPRLAVNAFNFCRSKF